MQLAQGADGINGKGLMTETLMGMSLLEKATKKTVTPADADRATGRELVKAVRARVMT